MASTENVDYERNSVQQVSWPELLSKTVDDLAHLGRIEIELLEATLKRLVEAQTDNIAGMLVLVFALAYASFFLFGGVVLLIHLWLAWWLSFLITGFAIALAGVGFFLILKSFAREKGAG